ncbi:Rap1a/Tai family immunity protein [Collimonas sp. NPDC087041]|uniref:Rap1a/Tai family immunity protein n=1 Tax=Collimonas sp. NPDC087041 TaxID=3363960 RepID=UPI00380C05E5
MSMLSKRLIFVFCALVVAQNCFALTVDELKRGLDQALASKVAATALATYITGYVHGSAEYGRSLGLVCDESGLRSTEDELRAVLSYLGAHPEEWTDGAQLLINRALMSPKCQH